MSAHQSVLDPASKADDLLAIERLCVKAWPALETAVIDGWLWRTSGGASKRANSVSTIEFTGIDPIAALDEAEARYRARGAAAIVHTCALSPHNIAELLKARGYTQGERTLTMVKRIGALTSSSAIEVTDRATPDWLNVYLGAINENRRVVNAKIIESIPKPSAFFGCRRADQVISTGLCVADGGYAVLECIATNADARRQGGAAAIVSAMEAWAAEARVHTLGLQVIADNSNAIALYEKLGFVAADFNQFWVR
ncbi:MAG TPA: GNAT family N-acetyltransferase [Xanthobacteraceae bacterium]|jgi:ribosomal protein S18 acetylase RimI-like enzyme|nr:GNAT family N-acetyltransferase [Xanthobacteraceae bacterium]